MRKNKNKNNAKIKLVNNFALLKGLTSMTPLERIQEKMHYFTKTEVIIANYILNNSQTFANQAIEETVSLLNVSKPAMIRFAKKLNYNGYSQFKFDLSYYLMTIKIENQTPSNNSVNDILQTLSSYCVELSHNLDQKALHTIANTIINARRIKLFAYHKCFTSAYLLKVNASKLKIDMDVLSDPVTMNDSITCLDNNDLVIIYTIDDVKDIYTSLIASLRSKHIPIVLLTIAPSNANASKADISVTLPTLYNALGYSIEDQLIFTIYNQLILQTIKDIQQAK